MQQATPQATLWPIPEALAPSLSELVKLESQAKAQDARRQELKEKLLAWADEQFCTVIRTTGELPAWPIRLITPAGEGLAYVLACGSKALKEDQVEELRHLLGESADQLLDRRCELQVQLPAIDRQEALAELLVEIFLQALKDATPRLKHLLLARDRDQLLATATTHRLKKTALADLLELSGKKKFAKYFEAIQPAVARYLKAG